MALLNYSSEALQAVEAVITFELYKPLQLAALGRLPVDAWSAMGIIISLATGKVPNQALLADVRALVLLDLPAEA